MNQLIQKNKNKRAITIQKYLRGFISRIKSVELLKDKFLYQNLEWLSEMRRKVLIDCQIKIRFAWRIYLRVKAAKEAKKKALAEANANKGKRFTSKKK